MPTTGLTLYRLHTPAAIGQALHAVQQQRGVLSVYAHSEPAEADSLPADAAPLAMACVVALDAQAHTLTLQAAAPLAAWPAQAVAVAHLAGGVRVQWPLQGDWQPLGAGHWQLHMPWPQRVLQLQRRQHPRLSVPLGHNYSASFVFGQRRCVLDIDDLSLGGVALRGTRQETAMLFTGRSLPQVQLYMAHGAVLQAALKVRARRRYHSFLLGEQVLVGCSVEAMSDADRLQLQTLLAAGI